MAQRNNDKVFKSWKALDVIGHFISEQVLQEIQDSDFVAVDISVLNFNVVYEIGYAIGKGKRILLIKNSSLQERKPTIREVGIFDTLGYKNYENSNQLIQIISNINNTNPIEIKTLINQRAPVFLLQTKNKTDWMLRIISRIKKARFIFRNFDPDESPRLSAFEAINQVSTSHGVVVPLVSNNIIDNDIHNMRGAFIAGLADGMNKAICLLQDGDEPVPVDYRDFVKVTYHPNDINDYIAEFAGKVMEAFQEGIQYKKEGPTTFLQGLDLGSSSAENEMRTLDEYYLETEQFLKSIRGESHLVVGRKGSGKSAIFLQIRDKERNRTGNIVLDLKPDGYKLIKFKELILKFLQEGTFQHTIMAFWEYVLLLEICHRILEVDHDRYMKDHDLYEPYLKLLDLYKTDTYSIDGDFSERTSCLMEKIANEYRAKYGDSYQVRLSTPQITEILYFNDVKELTNQIISYMKRKKTIWLLFDNIDKGWSTHGLKHEDLIIVRTLIDASRKIERNFDKHGINVNSIIFLRNDVYELLVKETADRGKEANVLLDWTDPDLLRELLRLRIISNQPEENNNFSQVWLMMIVSHYRGEESSQYLIERSLMRPRFLLNLVNHCKSFAVNLNHEKIQEDDIEKGLFAYSTDLLTDISYEIRDIIPEAEDILYAFIDSQTNITHEHCLKILSDYGMDQAMLNELIELLLWYGFLGIRINSDEEKYIYNFNYNLKLLKALIQKNHDKISYSINPAFWPALMINE
jgi:hypothetical protein